MHDMHRMVMMNDGRMMSMKVLATIHRHIRQHNYIDFT